MFGIELRHHIAVALGLADFRTDRAAQRAIGRLSRSSQFLVAAAELVDRAYPQARLVRLHHHPFDQLSDAIKRGGAAIERCQMPLCLAGGVALYRSAVELPFVAERVVQTLPANFHGIGQHADRRGGEAVFAKYAYGGIERYILVKFFGSSHEMDCTHIGTFSQ